jgi:DNA-binding NarL/FixJ family response regulator
MNNGSRHMTGAGARRELAFTSRETAILCLIAAGRTNREAAGTLHLSPYTVAQHIAEMLRRARAKTRGELIARAYAEGFLAPGTWPPQASASATT